MEDILKSIENMLDSKQNGIEGIYDAVSGLIDKYEVTLLEQLKVWGMITKRQLNRNSPLAEKVKAKIQMCENIIEELYEIKKQIGDV